MIVHSIRSLDTNRNAAAKMCPFMIKVLSYHETKETIYGKPSSVDACSVSDCVHLIPGIPWSASWWTVGEISVKWPNCINDVSCSGRSNHLGGVSHSPWTVSWWRSLRRDLMRTNWRTSKATNQLQGVRRLLRAAVGTTASRCGHF